MYEVLEDRSTLCGERGKDYRTKLNEHILRQHAKGIELLIFFTMEGQFCVVTEYKESLGEKGKVAYFCS